MTTTTTGWVVVKTNDSGEVHSIYEDTFSDSPHISKGLFVNERQSDWSYWETANHRCVKAEQTIKTI